MNQPTSLYCVTLILLDDDISVLLVSISVKYHHFLLFLSGRCELLDETMVKIINQANPHSATGPWLEETCLLYEITGLTWS